MANLSLTSSTFLGTYAYLYGNTTDPTQYSVDVDYDYVYETESVGATWGGSASINSITSRTGTDAAAGSGGLSASASTMMIAGTAISAVGSLVCGYYASKTAKYQLQMQERLAEFNQRQAERNAQAALKQSAARIGQISEKYDTIKAKQKASMAANGVVLGVGSAAEVTTSTDLNKTRDIQTEYANGYRQAAGYYTQAAGYSIQASNASAQASAISPIASGLASLSTSVTSGVKDYLMINQAAGGGGLSASLLLG